MSSGDPRNAPLGVFDSGLGGLTVVREIRRALPREHIIYLGDTARVPYGTRSPETVLRYSRGCAQLLIERGVKALVIACNTASAYAVDMLRAELDLPVLGVIEPGARAGTRVADLARVEGRELLRIGVLGTSGTVRSGAYPRAVGRLSTRLEVIAQAAPLLVPLVEEGWLEGEVPRLALERYLAPLVAQEVGVIVLGCTHYPLLKSLVAEVAEGLAGHPIPVVDSAEATALSLRTLLEERDLKLLDSDDEPPASGDALELLVSDTPESFALLAARFLGHEVARVEQVDISLGGH